jgi:hypothetical protein
MDITRIPTAELRNDYRETLADILLCKFALSVGAETYGDNESTQDRLTINEAIRVLIETEAERRGIEL